MDEATGLYEYGFRYYDPSIGRFTGVDPIADQFPWVSVYNYAENEPIAHIDLHGLQKYKPKIERLDGPGDFFSMKTLNNAKEGLKTIAVEFFDVLLPDQGNASTEDFHDESGSYEGSGIEVLSNSGLNAEGTLDTPEAIEGATVILETDEISQMMPADAGGALGDAAEGDKVTNAIFRVGKMIEEINNASGQNVFPSSSEPVDSTCNTCTGEPHGNYLIVD